MPIDNHCALRRALGAVVLVALSACAAPRERLDPASLPLHHRHHVLTIDYRLDQEASQVEAVGVLGSDHRILLPVRLRFLGVSADGRVVSQGFTMVDATFGLPRPFSVSLRPAGTEARFELQVDDHAFGLWER